MAAKFTPLTQSTALETNSPIGPATPRGHRNSNWEWDFPFPLPGRWGGKKRIPANTEKSLSTKEARNAMRPAAGSRAGEFPTDRDFTTNLMRATQVFPLFWVQAEYFLTKQWTVRLGDVIYAGSSRAESFVFLNRYADRDTLYLQLSYWLL